MTGNNLRNMAKAIPRKTNFILLVLIPIFSPMLPIASNSNVFSGKLLKQIDYFTKQPLEMNMSSIKEISLNMTFDEDLIQQQVFGDLSVTFNTSTISPQFNILSLDSKSTLVPISMEKLRRSNYTYSVKLSLYANYIGHAILQPKSIEYFDSKTRMPMMQLVDARENSYKLPVTIVQFEGIWGKVFIISVAIFMLISYINLGAQLDEENVRQIINKPKTLILGFLISALVMPMLSWFVGQWFLKDQLLYRIGSFIFACSPAASASTLWTVMLNSDKELSVGLQVVSTIGALVTMPSLLYLMDKSNLNLGNSSLHHHKIKVPYGRLIQTLLALLMALLIGWRYVGKNERAQKISRRVFRPLVFFVLIFIIVFSSILYWHIYQMFDWNITLASLIITILTYIVAGLLGHFINCDLDRGVAISISSAYKNSGIAFAVLLVAFEAPDTYIAYVPCLTQIVLTSIILYVTYCIKSLIGCCTRRYSNIT